MKTTQGYYGSSHNPCTIFEHNGWYVVEGSQNVNQAGDGDIIRLGVDVETVQDFDCFTWPDGIHSEEDLEEAIDA